MPYHFQNNFLNCTLKQSNSNTRTDTGKMERKKNLKIKKKQTIQDLMNLFQKFWISNQIFYKFQMHNLKLLFRIQAKSTFYHFQSSVRLLS